MKLDLSVAKEYLSYDAGTGLLTWIKNTSHTKVGSIAGTIKPQRSGKKYVRVSFRSQKVYAHRLIWLLAYGEWPPSQIDHINGNGLNNRLDNLRLSSPRENAMNRRLNVKNKSGAPGVYSINNGSAWTAMIRIEGRLVVLGRFKDKDKAIQTRKAAERQLGFHENHGSVRPL